jgi:hypothetical protein
VVDSVQAVAVAAWPSPRKLLMVCAVPGLMRPIDCAAATAWEPRYFKPAVKVQEARRWAETAEQWPTRKLPD